MKGSNAQHQAVASRTGELLEASEQVPGNVVVLGLLLGRVRYQATLRLLWGCSAVVGLCRYRATLLLWGCAVSCG